VPFFNIGENVLFNHLALPLVRNNFIVSKTLEDLILYGLLLLLLKVVEIQSQVRGSAGSVSLETTKGWWESKSSRHQ